VSLWAIAEADIINIMKPSCSPAFRFAVDDIGLIFFIHLYPGFFVGLECREYDA
jgi:hypothetical protein